MANRYGVHPDHIWVGDYIKGRTIFTDWSRVVSLRTGRSGFMVAKVQSADSRGTIRLVDVAHHRRG